MRRGDHSPGMCWPRLRGCDDDEAPVGPSPRPTTELPLPEETLRQGVGRRRLRAYRALPGADFDRC
jgi:hypothetical protein